MKQKSLPKLLLVLLLFSGWCTNTIIASGTTKYEEGKVYEHTLKNGMKVLTIERHIAPLIYHQLTYKVGSRNEKLGITGMSHVVEHMMFKGTQKYGKGEASKIISNNSGIFNAFTMNDMTSYYEYLPANKIEIAMDIESDRMQNAIFNPDEFTSEIEVIKQERRMRSESQANGILREMMNSVAYISSPNRDPVIGWPADLDNMTRDEAYAYYKTYYTPNNSFLLLIGDFETDEILQLVEKYYSNIPEGPEIPGVWSTEEKQKVRKSFTLHHTDITNPGMRMAFHAPVYTDPDAAPLRLAGMILCERSRDARLYKRLVEKERIATVAAGGFGMSKDPGLFQISVALRPDSSVERAEQLVWEEIEKMQLEPVTEHELQKVKNRYKYTQATSYTKNTDIGGSLSRYEAYFGWEFREEFDKKLLNVTQEDIMGVMNKYFAPHLVTVALSYPKKGTSDNINSDGIKSDEIESHHFDDSEMFYYQPPVEAINLTSDLLSAELDEVIKPKPIYPLIHSTNLKNGIKLHVIQNHLVPTLSIIGTFETGNIPEAIEGEKPGIVTFMTDAMNRGSVNYPYSQVTERMAFVPFSFGLSGSYRGIYFQGNSLIENMDEMLSTGFDLLTNPTFLAEQLEKIRPQHVISARNRLKKTSMQAFYYMYNKLFEDHTLTKVNSTEETIKSITGDDLFELHKKYIRPDNLTILMIGDLTTEQMKELAEEYFGNWSNESNKPEINYCEPVKELAQKEIKVFTDNDYTECTINIGFSPFNNVDPNENEIVSVLNYILAGSALTSRMGVELRDKQGLIYGIKSELFSKVDNIGYWKFNTKTGPENTEKVITGIFKEIRKLLDNGITDEELIDAKNRQLGLLPFYVETPDDAAGIVFDMI
ncbi:MAG: pitrilysin family protein, partial [Ignavibacteriaceae bacterium]